VRRAFALVAVTLWASGAGAAELPSRGVKTKTPEEKAHVCFIDGERGVETPGGMCVRIGGYVSLGVGAGNVRH
jgi:hypothetical protein